MLLVVLSSRDLRMDLCILLLQQEVLDCCMHLMQAGGSSSNFDRVCKCSMRIIHRSPQSAESHFSIVF